MTVEELRIQEEQRKKNQKLEDKRLKEKVLCAEVGFPPQMQRSLGVSGLMMKASELEEFVENEIQNRDGNTVTFTIRFMRRTNKWIETLPEANI